MKVGDLVAYTRFSRDGKGGWLGLIVGFDDDKDPIVMWNVPDGRGKEGYTNAEYRKHVKVIDESR
jgi:hypothetical protein